jgi:hypothetical protein
MLRAAVFALAVTGLTLLAAGVLDAAPLVNWGSREELATIAHGRSAVLAGAALTLAAAAAFAALRERRAAALLAVAALLPAASLLTAPHSALALLVLVPALGAGVAGALVGSGRVGLAPSAVLGVVALVAAAASGIAWGVVVAAALTLGAYLHARAGGRDPRTAVASLLPGAGFAALAAIAVFAGGTLAA